MFDEGRLGCSVVLVPAILAIRVIIILLGKGGRG